eukprot:SAG31_NODE_41695_length_275_cov_0.573864_1_plen_42_part_01
MCDIELISEIHHHVEVSVHPPVGAPLESATAKMKVCAPQITP